METIDLKPQKGARCPLCHESLANDDPRRDCSLCSTVVHQACAEELAQGCPVLGCAGDFHVGQRVSSAHHRVHHRRRLIHLLWLPVFIALLFALFQDWKSDNFLGLIGETFIRMGWSGPFVVLWGLFFSVIRIRQLNALRRRINETLPAEWQGRLVSLSGTPEQGDYLVAPSSEDQVVWFKAWTQAVGKAPPGAPSTIGNEAEVCAVPFRLGPVTVSNAIDQVRDPQSRITELVPPGSLAQEQKRHVRWIQADEPMVVVGQLKRRQGDWILDPERMCGLLLSRGKPEDLIRSHRRTLLFFASILALGLLLFAQIFLSN